MLIIQRCNGDLRVRACDIAKQTQTVHYSRCHFRDENTVNLCTIPKPFILNERWQQRESETDRRRQRERHQKKSDILIFKQTTRRWVKPSLLCLSIPSSSKQNTTNALKPTLAKKHSRGLWGLKAPSGLGRWTVHSFISTSGAAKLDFQIMEIQSIG